MNRRFAIWSGLAVGFALSLLGCASFTAPEAQELQERAKTRARFSDPKGMMTRHLNSLADLYLKVAAKFGAEAEVHERDVSGSTRNEQYTMT